MTLTVSDRMIHKYRTSSTMLLALATQIHNNKKQNTKSNYIVIIITKQYHENWM